MYIVNAKNKIQLPAFPKTHHHIIHIFVLLFWSWNSTASLDFVLLILRDWIAPPPLWLVFLKKSSSRLVDELRSKPLTIRILAAFCLPLSTREIEQNTSPFFYILQTEILMLQYRLRLVYDSLQHMPEKSKKSNLYI